MGWQSDIAKLSERDALEYMIADRLRLDQKTDRIASFFVLEFRMSPAESRIAARLHDDLGDLVRSEFLITAMEPKEEVEDASNVLRTHILRMKRKLKRAGSYYSVKNAYGSYALIDTRSAPRLNAPTGVGAGAE